MSRAEYFRQYRQRRKASAEPEDKLDVVIELLRDVAQQLHNMSQRLESVEKAVAQQLRNNVADVALQTATVAQQNATVAQQDKPLPDNVLGDIQQGDVAQHVAQNVAQHVATTLKPKRKGFRPPSSPPSPPPHTPPTSSPLLSPHLPKEKPAPKIAISSGESLPDTSGLVETAVEDFDDKPLVNPGKNSTRDLATHNDLVAASSLILDETHSYNLQDAFYDWIEYKAERGAKDFYTRKGIAAEARRFIKRHLEGCSVPAAVVRAIASNWQGWDHDLDK